MVNVTPSSAIVIDRRKRKQRNNFLKHVHVHVHTHKTTRWILDSGGRHKNIVHADLCGCAERVRVTNQLLLSRLAYAFHPQLAIERDNGKRARVKKRRGEKKRKKEKRQEAWTPPMSITRA